MLDEVDIALLHEHAWVYDHSWPCYAGAMGEPYLKGSYLLYFDGITLFVCAYALDDEDRRLGGDELAALVASESVFWQAQAIDVWGSLGEIRESFHVDGHEFTAHSVDRTSDGCDYVLDLARLVTDPSAHQKKRLRRARKLGYTMRLHSGPASHQHMLLLQKWVESHELADNSAPLALAQLMESRNISPGAVDLFEVYSRPQPDPALAGARITFRSSGRLNAINSFYAAGSFPSIGDGVLLCTIDHAISQGLPWLSLGYAGTEGLHRFKAEWGAVPNGHPYSEVLYRRSDCETVPAPLFWQVRLLAGGGSKE